MNRAWPIESAPAATASKKSAALPLLEAESMSERFGRYLDVDDDGICYRTYPGTHANKGGQSPRFEMRRMNSARVRSCWNSPVNADVVATECCF